MSKSQTTFNFSQANILPDIIRQIIAISDPEKIILFGSRAKGTERTDSDYDICVLKKRIKSNRKWACKIRASIQVLVPIDLVVSTPKNYEELKGDIYLVYYDIAKEGRVVYEK